MTPIDFTDVRVATVLEEVAAEREKQRAKWGDDHDDGHTDGVLALAAGYLAGPAGITDPYETDMPWNAPDWVYRLGESVRGNRRRELIIAAALLVAEVERLDRATERESE